MIGFSTPAITEMQSVICHMRSHGVVLTATRHGWMHPILTSAILADTRLTYPGGMEGWVDAKCFNIKAREEGFSRSRRGGVGIICTLRYDYIVVYYTQKILGFFLACLQKVFFSPRMPQSWCWLGLYFIPDWRGLQNFKDPLPKFRTKVCRWNEESGKIRKGKGEEKRGEEGWMRALALVV